VQIVTNFYNHYNSFGPINLREIGQAVEAGRREKSAGGMGCLEADPVPAALEAVFSPNAIPHSVKNCAFFRRWKVQFLTVGII
jgi:hypothetical protein